MALFPIQKPATVIIKQVGLAVHEYKHLFHGRREFRLFLRLDKLSFIAIEGISAFLQETEKNSQECPLQPCALPEAQSVPPELQPAPDPASYESVNQSRYTQARPYTDAQGELPYRIPKGLDCFGDPATVHTRHPKPL